MTGLVVVAEGLPLPVGSLCEVRRQYDEPVAAQVVGLRGERQILMTLHEPLGVGVGDPVTSTAGLQNIPVGRELLGCVIDGLGRPIGKRKSFAVEAHYPVYTDAPPALGATAAQR